MKTLPNGVKIFNSTPHTITFWSEDWAVPVQVEPDEQIDAQPTETIVDQTETLTRVLVQFRFTTQGLRVIAHTRSKYGQDTIIVGSMIAAQAYPGAVVAMIPAPGYERRPPAEKRMRPDKFAVYC